MVDRDTIRQWNTDGLLNDARDHFAQAMALTDCTREQLDVFFSTIFLEVHIFEEDAFKPLVASDISDMIMAVIDERRSRFEILCTQLANPAASQEDAERQLRNFLWQLNIDLLRDPDDDA